MFRINIAAATLACAIAVAGPLSAREKGPFDFETLHPPPAPVAAPAGPAYRLGLSRVLFDITPGTGWMLLLGFNIFGNIPETILPWSTAPSDVATGGYQSVFREELRASGFPTDSGGDLFDTEDREAELLVGARITDLRAKLCHDCTEGGRRPNGAMLMGIEWQVYSPLERRVLATTTTVSTATTNKDPRTVLAILLPATFRMNVQKLLADPTFRDAVISSKAASAVLSAATPLSPIFIRLPPPDRRAVGEATASVATIFATGGHGSGFLVSDQGYLLTNQHVVGGTRYVKVRWADGSEELGEVVRVDRGRDVALVKVASTKRRPLAIRAGALGAGETVYAIGTPLDDKYDASVTRGVVSANRVEDGRPFIQSDVTVNHGNSGGPLIDEAGQVVGITASGLELNGVPAGVNLFIPIGDALAKLALVPAA